ncbi:hypothetical protein [Sphingomonas sp.]|jgi:hypothetical protein|uniref:hypothetical protein n=1 Tax=Sphingomonas sp. TaxID=28214 RepID=UPI002E3029EB|nr:hypothetical protein [Sphingomonas sp.]HEX4695483.1 hypothetical protein [Sphingomonas sp.]
MVAASWRTVGTVGTGLLLCSLAILPTAASPATDVLGSTGQGFLVSGMPSGDHSYTNGDIVFKAALVWGQVAHLSTDVRLPLDGHAKTLFTDSPLVRVALRNVPGLRNEAVVAYCSPREIEDSPAGTMMLGLLGKFMRSRSDQQYCLADADGDGRLDMGFELRGGSPSARVAQPIAPVAFDVRENMPVSGDNDRISIIYSGTKNGVFWFALDLRQKGKSTKFTTLSAGQYSATPINRVDARRGLPAQANIYGVPITIKAYDSATGAVTLDWRGAETGEFIPVATETAYRVRYY